MREGVNWTKGKKYPFLRFHFKLEMEKKCDGVEDQQEIDTFLCQAKPPIQKASQNSELECVVKKECLHFWKC